MNKVLAAAAVAATLVAGSAVSAQAQTQYAFGPFTETGKFTDVMAYTFTKPAKVTGIIFGDSSGETAFGTVRISGTSFSSNAGGLPFFAKFKQNILVTSGDSLLISGTAPSDGALFNGNITVSQVPLPTSVALFGTAVLGLGVVGAVRRKGAKLAASATA